MTHRLKFEHNRSQEWRFPTVRIIYSEQENIPPAFLLKFLYSMDVQLTLNYMFLVPFG